MKPVEYDVYLCCRDVEDRGMASEAAAGLERLGFRVFVAGRDRGAAPDRERLKAIEEAPDFVLLSSPPATGPGGEDDDSRVTDLAHAFKTERNIVVLADPADADPLAAPDPPGLPRLASWQRVIYDRGRTRESIALVGHRLVSSSDVEDRRLMRTAKRALVVTGLILASAVALRAVPAAVRWWNRPTAPPPLPRFTLYWTAFGQRFQNGQWTSLPVADGSAVAGGDQLRLVFSAGSDGFAYVVLRDDQGGLSLAYPGATLRGASRVRAGVTYEAPVGDHWFAVDPRSGLDAIYLLAGHEPLENVEELAEESEGGGNPAARMELLSSTVAGLIDGKHAAAPRPIRTRGGREIIDGLSPVAPPLEWSATLASGSVVTNRPAVQTGLLSAVVEIRFRPALQD
jgi:hypothetical protein